MYSKPEVSRLCPSPPTLTWTSVNGTRLTQAMIFMLFSWGFPRWLQGELARVGGAKRIAARVAEGQPLGPSDGSQTRQPGGRQLVSAVELVDPVLEARRRETLAIARERVLGERRVVLPARDLERGLGQ